MSSSFKGVDLFGSGPHVFEVGRQGRRVVSISAVSGDPSAPGSFESGDYELRVTVRGRLVASSESALWRQALRPLRREAIRIGGGAGRDLLGAVEKTIGRSGTR